MLRCVRENPAHPLAKLGLAAQRAERQRHPAAPHPVLGKRGQAGRIGLGRVGRVEHALVAGKLALEAQPALDPGQRRVSAETRPARSLQQVQPIVGAAQVACLVQHNLLQLGGGELLDQPARDQNFGRKEANDAGAVDLIRDADLRAAMRPHLRR